MPQQHATTVLLRERTDHNKLKVAAVVAGIPIGELLDQMVDRELLQYTKVEAAKLLDKHPRRDQLLAVL